MYSEKLFGAILFALWIEQSLDTFKLKVNTNPRSQLTTLFTVN